MKKALLLAIFISAILVVSIAEAQSEPPTSSVGNYNLTYHSGIHLGFLKEELHVSVPSSLYDYYDGNPIKISRDSDYSKLVTPDAVKPIADNILNLTLDKPRSDEEFANAVLTLVHQIPYADCDTNFPVETLVENSGKCDTLSLLAASIMKAGGLDVVLLYFKEVHHINVGVHLNNEPRTTWWWLKSTGYKFEGKTYWIAECTPAMNWRVGDVPPLLVEETPWIISLEKSEEASPARISSRLSATLNSSSISINLSSAPSDYSYQERQFVISGSISPVYANAAVTLYYSKDGISYNSIKTETDTWGKYSFAWSLNSTGTCYLRTSWSGNADCAGADSEILTVFVGFPQSSIQLDGVDYYYTYACADAATHDLYAMQGVEDFLDVQLSGTGVLLTGEFIILKNGQNTSKMQTKTVATPKRMELIASFVGEKVFCKPELNITVPANIPEASQLVRIPNDFEQTTNNQFSFVLRKSGESNYSFNVRGLDNCDVVELTEFGGNGTTIMNTSNRLIENTWYKVEARISENGITAEVYDTNGTIMESVTNKYDVVNSSDLVILLANNKDRAVAFKNLNIELLNQTQLADDAQEISTGGELLVASIALIILLVTFFVAIINKKTR
jgi:hypothetical protein